MSPASEVQFKLRMSIHCSPTFLSSTRSFDVYTMPCLSVHSGYESTSLINTGDAIIGAASWRGIKKCVPTNAATPTAAAISRLTYGNHGENRATPIHTRNTSKSVVDILIRLKARTLIKACRTPEEI